jgi:hypothetical protein
LQVVLPKIGQKLRKEEDNHAADTHFSAISETFLVDAARAGRARGGILRRP